MFYLQTWAHALEREHCQATISNRSFLEWLRATVPWLKVRHFGQ